MNLFDEKNKKKKNLKITVYHNGVIYNKLSFRSDAKELVPCIYITEFGKNVFFIRPRKIYDIKEINE